MVPCAQTHCVFICILPSPSRKLRRVEKAFHRPLCVFHQLSTWEPTHFFFCTSSGNSVHLGEMGLLRLQSGWEC